nr:zinc knuckle CX2CX4HX4C [Tanacetum cinerariifolium]
MVNPPIGTTSNVVTLTIEKTNNGFKMVGKKKKRKGKSKSTNGGQFVGPSIKQNVRYEPKATTSASNKGATNGNPLPKKLLGNKIASWSFKKQDCTSMYNAEAGYVSLSTSQVIWMRTQLLD